jgi:hypothetical protein
MKTRNHEADTTGAVLEFQWHRDSAGYELSRDKRFVRRRGGPMLSYFPAREAAIHRRASRLDGSPEALLRFVNEWGYLGTVYGNADAEQEALRPDLEQISRLRGFDMVWSPLGEWQDASEPNAAALDAFNKIVDAPHMTVRIQETRGGGRRLQLLPVSLYAWIWLAVAQEITREVTWRPCARPACGKLFAIGRGQSSAKRLYCSASCQVMSSDYYLKKRGKK